LETFG